MSDQDKTTLLEFEVARSNRQFEIQMFWQRSNYFLALNSALAVGFFALSAEGLIFLVSLVGMIASWLWYRTALGARYWQVFWEAEVHRLSKILKITAFAKTDDEILSDTIRFGRTKGKSYLRRYVDKQVSKKPSVSFNMILLSMLTMLFWVLINAFLLVKFLITLCSACV